MKTHFKSRLATLLTAFVAMKQLGGSEYKSSIITLIAFDRFISQSANDIGCITEVVYSNYLKTCTHISTKSRTNRITVIRQFCRFAREHQPARTWYIPEIQQTVASQGRRCVHIYSAQEIKHLLEKSRLLPPRESLRGHTVQTLLTLLYTTGMRGGEAFALNIEDLDLHKRLVFIREGKYKKSRWVPISQSCAEKIAEYIEARCQFAPPEDRDAALFVNLRRSRLAHCNVNPAFNTVLRMAGITGKPKPRMHDLRHTFAVHRLCDWYREGKDVNSLLPVLATYLGHVHLAHTAYYIHQTHELLNLTGKQFENYYQSIITQEAKQ